MYLNVMIAERLIGNGETYLWSWQWIEQLSANEEQQVEDLTDLLVAELDPNVLVAIRKLWRNDVPSKITVFGWRLLLERLPTRMALHH
ncbi:hypothetical protein A2U01_0057229, partial [Trifolium medium]|nr:hypothetical protein [Trifolium medium]